MAATTTTTIKGAAAGAAATAPLAMIFNEQLLAVAIFGAAGGATRGLALSVTWRETSRLMLLGLLFAAGVGALWPIVLEAVGIRIPDELLLSPKAAMGGSYLLGLGAVTILARLLDEKKDREKGDGNA